MQEKIKRIDSEMGSSSADNIGEDAVTQVLGKDKPGELGGWGEGLLQPNWHSYMLETPMSRSFKILK